MNVTRPLLAVPVLFQLCSGTAAAQDLVAKADTGISDFLNVDSSWQQGVVPGSNDIALFDATMATANNNQNRIGGDLSFRGIKVVDPKSVNVSSGFVISASSVTTPAFAYTGTLSLGASGIDLSEAVKPAAISTTFFGISTPITLTADQTWNIPRLSATLGRELALSGSTFTTGRRTANLDFGGRVVTKSGAGVVGILFDRQISNGRLEINEGTVAFANALNPSTNINVIQDTLSSLVVNVNPTGTLGLAMAPTTGTGTLNWAGTTTLKGGTLWLNGGNYTGPLTVGGTLTAATGTTSVIKYDNAATPVAAINVTLAVPLAGSGDLNLQMTTTRTQDRLLLAGNDSTFSGDLTISAGHVLVTNTSGSATGTGSVIVAPGAILGGTGTTGPLAMGGTYEVTIDDTYVEGLLVQGELAINGATLDLKLPGAGFTGSSYVIAEASSITGTGFTSVPAGYQTSVVAGGIGQQLVLSVAEGDAFTDWIATFPGVPAALDGPDDDADGDGLSNAIEFVLDGNPASGTAKNLPVAAAGPGELAFTFIRRKDAAGAGYVPSVEWSTSLATDSWTGISASVVGSDALTETLRAVIPAPVGATRVFARLKVEHP